MTTVPAASKSPDRQRRGNAVIGLAAALAFSLFGLAAQAAPAKEILSSEDKACLECHAKPGLARTLGDGQQLSLHVAARAFAQSVHNESGCEACHSGLQDAHDRQPRKVASRRALASELMEQCRDCHKKTMKQYEDSVHSALVRAGSDQAPLCTDCHNPHTARPAKEANGQAQAAPCQKCHEGISKALAGSVHGQGGEEALVCKDCHRTHNVKAAALGDHMKNECLACHKDVATTHAQWLPNTERHLEAISCPACHSPGTTRRVNLRLYEGGAPQQAAKVGVPTFVRLASAADGTAAGLDARALWSMLQEFNQDAPGAKTVLRGRLEVQTGVQAHQLAAKALALKECDACHRRGAASFQAVTVSMAGPDGRPLRHEASKGVLTSVESIGSIGGFYAIGSTRIVLLDVLLLLAVAGGILLPGAHLAAKLYFKRQRERRRAVDAATAPDDRR